MRNVKDLYKAGTILSTAWTALSIYSGDYDQALGAGITAAGFYMNDSTESRWPIYFPGAVMIGLGTALVGSGMRYDGYPTMELDSYSKFMGNYMLIGGLCVTALSGIFMLLDKNGMLDD